MKRHFGKCLATRRPTVLFPAPAIPVMNMILFIVCRLFSSQQRLSLGLKLHHCIKCTLTDTLKELFQLKHIVRQKNQHRVIAGIGSPPASEGAGPANRTHPTATRHWPRFEGIKYCCDTQPESMTGVEHCPGFCPLVLAQTVGYHSLQ